MGATVATATLSLLLIRFFMHAVSSVEWYTGIITFVVVAAIGYVALQIYNKKWDKVKYKLTHDSILIVSANGLTGVSRQVFLYESIISAHMTQGYLGKKYGYGDIVLVIPKLDGEVKLKDLSVPKTQLEELQSQLKHRVTRRQTLVT